MQFYIHKIQNPVLQPYIQYILFSYNKERTPVKEITSFANTNICLGVLKESELTENATGDKVLVKKEGISSYISGLYSSPHRLIPGCNQDEICIDFFPLGYYHFFPFPVKKYILNSDILSEAFGEEATHYFEAVFREDDLVKRAHLIETFFCSKAKKFEDAFLNESLYHIHRSKGDIKINDLSRTLKCSEKKLYRAYVNNFDLSPQDYIRIVKFRNALVTINNQPPSLTRAAYQCGYYDQSHFIREIRFFTSLTPKHCISKVLNIGNTVSLSIC